MRLTSLASQAQVMVTTQERQPALAAHNSETRRVGFTVEMSPMSRIEVKDLLLLDVAHVVYVVRGGPTPSAVLTTLQ